MICRLAAAVLVLALAACGSGDSAGPDTDFDDDGIRFVEVESPDGTRYRCLWAFEQHYHAGGAGLWCERLDP